MKTVPWDSEVGMAMSWVDIFRKSATYKIPLVSLDYESGTLSASQAVWLWQVFPSWMPYSGWIASLEKEKNNE